MWDRNMDGKVCSADLISVFLHIFTLSWSVPKVSSYHSKRITLDKYTFELGYDDEFDMGEIAQLTTKEIAHFRRVCPGRREWRRDARVEAEVGPQAHRQLFHCPGKKVIFVQLCSKSERKLLCSCTSHLASLSSPPTSLSSCRPPVSSPGVESQWGFTLWQSLTLSLSWPFQGDGVVRPLLNEQRYEGQRPPRQLCHHGRHLVWGQL